MACLADRGHAGRPSADERQRGRESRGGERDLADDEWFDAKCAKGRSEIPDEGCCCGLYAARDRQHLIELQYGAYGENGR